MAVPVGSEVAVAVGEPSAAERLADGLGLVPASADDSPAPAEGAAAAVPAEDSGRSEGDTDSSDAEVDPVRPFLPSASPDDPEKANPAITAATDTAPAAPAATTVLRDRRALGLRRLPGFRCAVRRPGAGPAAPAAVGSSAVASYSFCQPCAAAGSVYSSYAGADSGRGWYTFGAPWGSAPAGTPSAPVAAFAPYAPFPS